MNNIDIIMKKLDDRNSDTIQKEGLQLAREIESYNVFMQPHHPELIGTWHNCAIIISEKTDSQLSWYLVSLMEWIEDMHQDGAHIIYNRLCKYKKDIFFNTAYSICLKYAKAEGNENWLATLHALNKAVNDSQAAEI